MSAKANTIILNGRRYDTATGRLLDAPTKNAQSAKLAYNRGPVRPTGKAGTTSTTKVVAPLSASKVRHIDGFVRPAAAPAKRHPAKHSQTLSRHSVAKPVPSLKRHLKAQTRTDVLIKKPTIEVKPKLSSYHIDPKRAQHAKQIPRHSQVSRYAKSAPALPATTTAKPAPVVAAKPQPAQVSQAVATAKPAAEASDDIFARALARANSHEQRPLTKRQVKRRKQVFSPRALSMASASLAVLLVVGFFAWHQRAELTMRYAAAKSGVDAHLPDYKPAGFSVGNFTYNPGLVAVNYVNPVNGSQFSLVERPTQWDSQSLRDNFVATSDQNFKTIDTAGRTIYTYGGNNATWVDNGIWYEINSEGQLSTDQLLNLATSL